MDVDVEQDRSRILRTGLHSRRFPCREIFGPHRVESQTSWLFYSSQNTMPSVHRNRRERLRHTFRVHTSRVPRMLG
jgi:hypothetical protein